MSVRVVGVLALLAALLIVDLIALAPITAGVGCLIVFSGVPVYLLWGLSAEG